MKKREITWKFIKLLLDIRSNVYIYFMLFICVYQSVYLRIWSICPYRSKRLFEYILYVNDDDNDNGIDSINNINNNSNGNYVDNDNNNDNDNNSNNEAAFAGF